jgi:hypothetical protein
MTGYLQAVIEVAQPYAVAAPILRDILGPSQPASVLDLASGGGGPWRDLTRELGDRISVTLSDVAPSKEAQLRFSDSAGIEYLSASISALDPPRTDHAVWTMFTGLHHFSPDEVRRLMSVAQSRNVTFCAFEATSRSGRGIAATLAIPLLVLLFMPRVRPRRVLPLLLTYLPPILPLLIWWDGFASTLRTYTKDELETMAQEVAVAGFHWQVRELPVRGSPIPVMALLGRPTRPVA